MSLEVKKLLGVAGVAVATIVAGCSSDSPTQPTPGGTPPGSGAPQATYTVTVTPNPGELERENPDQVLTSQISVRVIRVNDGTPPTGGAVSLSVDFGSFDSGTSSLVLPLSGGTATALYRAPLSGEGTARFTAQFDAFVGSATVLVRNKSPFFLSFVSPSTGDPSGGYSATVNGGGFKGPNQVLVNGVPAEILSSSSTQITVRVPPFLETVPPGETRPVNVSVVNEAATPLEAQATLQNGFVYAVAGSLNRPVLTSVTPNVAPRDGGTPLLIRGSGFESPVQVTMGPVNSSGVELAVRRVSPTEIEVVSPEARLLGNPNEALEIVVRNLGSGLTGRLPAAFRFANSIVVTAVSPNQGPYQGGQDVVVFGDGFQAPVQVLFEGIEQSVLSVSGRELLVRTRGVQPSGCDDIVADVRVTNLATGEFADGPSYRYRVLTPIVTGINPSSVLGGGGGQQATITGANFEAPLRVEFGDQSASVVSSTSTSIQVIVPALAGTFDEVACDDNGDGTEGKRFVNTAVDITVTNLVTGCSDTFTGGFQYRPTDTTCRGDVAPEDPGDGGGGGPSGEP